MPFNEEGLVGEQRWLYHWIVEREKCRIGNESGAPKPWSTDLILQNYRFCNVRREDDKVTKWLKENWRDPFEGNVNMVFAMCVARLFNRITTLEMIGFPDIPCGPNSKNTWVEETRDMLKEVRSNGAKIWTGAYLVSTNGHSMDKIDYILDKVLTPISDSLRLPNSFDTLKSYHASLMEFDGMGSFMAGQVIADLKYTMELGSATDWWTWAPIGPGSRRGLNRYFGRKLEGSINEEQVQKELNAIRSNVTNLLGLDLPVHDVQNCMCEFDKFCRVKNGEGKPRSSYNGGA